MNFIYIYIYFLQKTKWMIRDCSFTRYIDRYQHDRYLCTLHLKGLSDNFVFCYIFVKYRAYRCTVQSMKKKKNLLEQKRLQCVLTKKLKWGKRKSGREGKGKSQQNLASAEDRRNIFFNHFLNLECVLFPHFSHSDLQNS